MERTRLPLLLVLALAGCVADTDPQASTADIVGGTVAPRGAWPSMAGLMSGQALICGATLVAPDWVLTAAHCLRPYLEGHGISAVAVGRHVAESSAEGELLGVKRVIRHPGFDYFTTANDIALVQLAGRSTAPLARLARSTDEGAASDGAVATVIGWGLMAQSGAGSDVLRQVSLPIVDRARCRALPGYSNVTENMICALSAGKGTCQGDSGGPLWLDIGGQTSQVGVSSWSQGCAAPNAPSVYTSVARYRGWIAEMSNGAVPFE